MDNRKQALTELLANVEAGEFDARTYPLMKLPQMSMNTFENIHAAYNGSLDAAMALHEAVLPGWLWATGIVASPAISWVGRSSDCDGFDAESDNPARAWLIAIIKALIAEESE